MESNTFELYRLQELITRREGMIAENKQREFLQQAMVYTYDDFALLEKEIVDIRIAR